MPLIFKHKEPDRLALTTAGEQFFLIIEDIPSTTLFELAQEFQQGRDGAEADGRALIPAGFAQRVLQAVSAAAVDWEGVTNAEGNTLAFDRDTLRAILHRDVALIPQLISYIAEIFSRSQQEQHRLEGEEKNWSTSSTSQSEADSRGVAPGSAE